MTACPPSRSDGPRNKPRYIAFGAAPKDDEAAEFNSWNVRHIIAGADTDHFIAEELAESAVSLRKDAELAAKTKFSQGADPEAINLEDDIDDLEYPDEPTFSRSFSPPGSAPSSTPVLPGTAPALASSEILSLDQFRPPNWPNIPQSNEFSAALTGSLSPNIHTKSKQRLKRERQERRERDGSGSVSDSMQEDEESSKPAPRRSSRRESTDDDLKEVCNPNRCVIHLTYREQLEAPQRKRKVAQDDSDIDGQRQHSRKRKGKDRAKDASKAVEAEVGTCLATSVDFRLIWFAPGRPGSSAVAQKAKGALRGRFLRGRR